MNLTVQGSFVAGASRFYDANLGGPLYMDLENNSYSFFILGLIPAVSIASPNPVGFSVTLGTPRAEKTASMNQRFICL